MFTLSIILLFFFIVSLGISAFLVPASRGVARASAATFATLSAAALLFSMFTVVPASTVGVQSTFGRVHTDVLAEGAHFVAPWVRVHEVPISTTMASAEKSEAGSRDLQSVHANITVNYHVEAASARELYILNPSLNYEAQFVVPAIYETFKAVVAGYTAEELVTKRAEVSANISRALNSKLSLYHISVQNINLVNFGFSRAFDAAIEEKVTASQKSETAKRNLERVKYEAEQRIAQAEGEAKAIAIQAAAIEKQGGAAYTQLKAIEKWDGKLPTYMTSDAATPFVSIK